MNGAIQVEVLLYGAAQMMTGWAKQTVTLSQPSTIGDLLQTLYDADSSLQPLLEGQSQSLSALIMINSMDIKRKEGIQTLLNNGDRIEVVSMISGG